MSRAPGSDARTVTATITANWFWYVIDASASMTAVFVASVPVARVMGPQVLGHYIYLVFLTSMAQRLANVGIPATVCKYMSEYLGGGQPRVARQIFRVALRPPAIVATAVAAPG